VPLHFHAYAYTGHSYPDGKIRSGQAPSAYPAIEIYHQRLRPHTCCLTSAEDALAWLEKELSVFEPLDADAFPVTVRLEYSRARLQQKRANEVIYGYYSRDGRYVARQIHPCTDTAPDCLA
jgi:hypothetical protein